MNLYTIGWRNFNIVIDSLESMIKSASEPIDITFISPNDTLPNSGTTKIREHVRKLVAIGAIKRSLEFNKNGFGWCLIQAIKDFPPTGDIFWASDCDLIVVDDWINLTKKYHARGRVVTGFNLSLENYKHPNSGFNPKAEEFGMWMAGFNTEWFNKYHGTDQNTIDSRIMQLASNTGGYAKIRESELFHCTWSISYEGDRYYDPEYRDYKKSKKGNFAFDPKPKNLEYFLVERP